MKMERICKKTGISILTVAMLVLTACGAGREADKADVAEIMEEAIDSAVTTPEADKADNADNKEEKTDTVSDTETGLPLIGLVTSVGGIEDESFNQSAWEGLQRLEGMGKCTTKFYEGITDDEEFESNMQALVDDNAILSWGIGYDCADLLMEVASKNPTQSFAIVDYVYDDIPDNMTCVVFRAQESSFLAGYIAGYVSKTHKVGFVGGYDNEVIDQFWYGFQAGLAYAANENGADIEATAVYVDSFVDKEKGKSLAAELYDDGCDIVYHAAGQSGLGVIEAAKEADRYVIGVDKDQSYLAPDNVLTSALKNVNVAVCDISDAYIEGDIIGGRSINMGISDGAVGISEDHHLYPDEVYDAVMKLSDAIAEGDIMPPSNEEEYNDFIAGLK